MAGGPSMARAERILIRRDWRVASYDTFVPNTERWVASEPVFERFERFRRDINNEVADRLLNLQ